MHSERTKRPGARKSEPGDPATTRQREVLGVISAYIAENGFAPTIRELGDLIDCSSPNGVMCHLTALVKKGLITWKRGHARTIRVVEQKG